MCVRACVRASVRACVRAGGRAYTNTQNVHLENLSFSAKPKIGIFCLFFSAQNQQF
jgi:hypothetical protein